MPVRTVTEDDLGLKALYNPPKGTPIKYDIVAVHGIGAHPDYTWCKIIQQDGKRESVNWLANKTMLPEALPNARIMRYGANTQWFGEDSIQQTVSTIADSLLRALKRSRKALLIAANSPNHWPDIFDSLAGIAFLGTPFRGAEQIRQKELISEAQKLFKNQVHPGIFRITNPNDEMLKETVHGFMQKLIESRSTAQLTIRVSETSGCLDAAEKIGLQRTHYDMNKFGNPNEETYLIVQEKIVEMAQRSNLNSQIEHPRGSTNSRRSPGSNTNQHSVRYGTEDSLHLEPPPGQLLSSPAALFEPLNDECLQSHPPDTIMHEPLAGWRENCCRSGTHLQPPDRMETAATKRSRPLKPPAKPQRTGKREGGRHVNPEPRRSERIAAKSK
ncbi:hypothetical protein CHU98_g1080 [Xylaria longipes]|nr:hypothetical protein CHU98_g1080 [Xylaria longipes]